MKKKQKGVSLAAIQPSAQAQHPLLREARRGPEMGSDPTQALQPLVALGAPCPCPASSGQSQPTCGLRHFLLAPPHPASETLPPQPLYLCPAGATSQAWSVLFPGPSCVSRLHLDLRIQTLTSDQWTGRSSRGPACCPQSNLAPVLPAPISWISELSETLRST